MPVDRDRVCGPRVLVLGVAVAILFAGVQAAVVSKASEIAPLAGSDDIDIQMLYGRTLHDEGRATGTRYWLTNLVVEPVASSAPGERAAVGWPYVIQSRGLEMLAGALYRDRLVKSRGRWTIASREKFPGSVMPPREHYTPPGNEGPTTFSPRDYAEVKRIVMRYNLGYDNARPFDKGLLTGLSFAVDGIAQGVGGGQRPGRRSGGGGQVTSGLHHWDSNFLIDVSPAGEVTSIDYNMQFIVDERGSPVHLRSAGLARHRFGRTDEGWLIKFRRYDAAARSGIEWPPAGYGMTSAAVTPEAGAGRARGVISDTDFVEIDQLYARSNLAFDSGASEAFARTFTPDGSLVREGVTTKGSRALAALAIHVEPSLHTWTSNLVIEPTRSGATGRVYVLNFAEGEQPVRAVGRYEDVLVKARDGWRFKRRTYIAEAGGRR